ncbi:TPR repeat protein [Entamoeba histolytica HM-1:IMSS-B]|uniref:TPR repeat protein n=6 Tax=Entamoeba histolytica TaxID=5759 RepID=C4M1M2_ENTH1|nr:TPR repeat protein [Entamoeba histolytica HM-1:IMSS]EAL50030.1 TPR repeat protein [Entamoeba histolytica HM-1:IMSS]EMD47059.1 tetratricopeptide repeatcontaining protein tpr [Entamoeba histolytica KU27]EMH77053.1 TPR repeat protein [Entamoeba histolytica HM-1:IMSS-B]GAT95125.1 tpr repeat protein [Entamoeba histolytica]|eukprot:XP_655416.1 TPR repeat protein [Entamoeba histolytica HM-1:IMSS]
MERKKEGVPCILKRKQGTLVLEIENYGVVNISDKKYLQSICGLKKKRKEKHHKHSHNITEKKEQKKEEKEVNEKKEENPKEINEKKEESPKENNKKIETIKEVETINEQEDIPIVIETNRNEQVGNDLEVNQEILETKEEKKEEPKEQNHKEEKKKKGKPIPRDPNKPVRAKPNTKADKKIQFEIGDTLPEETLPQDEEDEEERVNYVAQRGMLTNGTNDIELDREIAKGYLYVNTGKLKEAIAHFDQLLKNHPNVLAGYLGRGSAKAMLGDLQKALTDFNLAVKKDSKCGDAYKRRGQVKLALGQTQSALEDFNKAIELTPEEGDCYRQRGSAYHALGIFDKAAEDIKKSIKLIPGDATLLNELALCYNGMGLVDESINTYTRAINTKEDYVEPYIHLGQLYRDIGCYVRAKQLLEKAMKLAPTNHLSYYVMANVLASAGRHKEALPLLSRSLSICPPERTGDIHRLNATACLALGMNRSCLKSAKLGYEAKDNASWYFGEIAKYQAMMIDKPFLEYDLEWFPPQWKVNFAKRLPIGNVKKYPPGNVPLQITTEDIDTKTTVKQELVKELLIPAIKVGDKMQYNELGFGKNGRQYLACGLGAICIAQLLQTKQMGWREIAEILVKFRQVAEPADGAIWIDKLPRQQFEEGFGSNTTLKTAQTRVARYWPMFPRTFGLFKKLFEEESGASKEKKQLVAKAETVDEVQKVLKRDNFFMTTICRNEEGTRLEGTWLLIEKVELGSMFSIKTPCTPKRYKIFDVELKKALDKYYTVQHSNDQDKILDAVLRFCYLWFNFMPLTRGTAGCGMYWMFGLLLSAGFKQVGVIPKGFQCDWEALLTDNQNDYITKMKSWIKLEKCSVSEMPNVLNSLPRLRDMLMALNISPLLVPLS